MTQPAGLTLASDHAAGESRPAILVIPGGGYAHYGPHEAEPVAHWFASLGLHAFVLRYPVAPHRHPEPLNAARAALGWIRSGDHGLAITSGKVAAIGFSAGGHLTASLATLPDGEAPDRVILGYPVISLEEESNPGSVENLLGPDSSPQLRHDLSPNRLVTSIHPPTFLWHTADDAAVPLSNALRYTAALAAAQVPVDLHVFARGVHGLGLANDERVAPEDDAPEWTGLCARWLQRAGWVSDVVEPNPVTNQRFEE